MISRPVYTTLNSKYCQLCILSLGLGYLMLKSTKIQKLVRLLVNSWSCKKNVTYVVTSTSEADAAVEILKRKINETKVLGMDCEWVSSNKGNRHPVALLQLAAPDGFCSLFRLCLLKSIPSNLVALLEDKDIIKVGVAVVSDARYLMADFGVNCEGCVDLRHLATEVGVEPKGLASLAYDLFEIELDKDWRIRCSNWEAEQLTPKQIEYAAKDACIAIDIFENLNHKAICKKHSFWQRLFWKKSDYWHQTIGLWSPYAGLNFKYRTRDGRSIRQSKPVDTIIKRNYNTLLQKQHYCNIFLLAPDNEVLCTISKSKADWYMQKKLVDIVCEEPKTLKLKFEPSRRSQEPDGYYTRPKQNKCVVCGSENDLRRKNVVPVEYRRHFDETLKNHHSHDVLLLCLNCHTRSNLRDHELRDQLVVECDAALAEGDNNKMRDLPELRALRSAARALYFNGDVIPTERKNYLEKVICDQLGVSSDQLTRSFLDNLVNIECAVESEQYVPHGLKVVQHYYSRGGPEELERRWRQHFLDSMYPRYLPELWSVNYARD